jgi:hypothetical protein
MQLNLSNAVGLLGDAAKLGSQLGKTGNLLSAATGSPYAAIASKILDKALEKAPGILDKVQNTLANTGASGGKLLTGANLVALGINDKAPVSANAAMDMVRDWDKNQDGRLSENELQQGLTDLEDKISKQKERASSGDAYEKTKLAEYQGMQVLGQKLLSQYQNVSKLDNQSGISINDVKLLAYQDNNPYTISNKELSFGTTV